MVACDGTVAAANTLRSLLSLLEDTGCQELNKALTKWARHNELSLRSTFIHTTQHNTQFVTKWVIKLRLTACGHMDWSQRPYNLDPRPFACSNSRTANASNATSYTTRRIGWAHNRRGHTSAPLHASKPSHITCALFRKRLSSGLFRCMKEAASTSETSANCYRTTWCNNLRAATARTSNPTQHVILFYTQIHGHE
jgi:hypothetical protein